MRPLLLCAALVVSLLSPGVGRAAADADASLPQVRIALQWSPQSQFAGFYLARAQGYYAEAGARVRLLHANAVHSSLELLMEGKADLATAFLADAIVATANAEKIQAGSVHHNEMGGNGMDSEADRVEGRPVPDARPVLIGQLVGRSNLMLLAWKDDGISRLEDLDGRRVSLMSGPFSAAVRALLAERQIQPELIPQYGTVNLFLHGGVAACTAMEYNELHRVWQAGVDKDRLTAFLLRELGFDFPEDGLYARSDWLADHGELALRLWQATLKGWKYAREHPEQALGLVLAEAERAGVPTNRPHERWMLEHLLASIFVEGRDPPSASGHLSAGAYAATAKALIAAGLMDEAPAFSVFCPGCGAEDDHSDSHAESRSPTDETPNAIPVTKAPAATPDQSSDESSDESSHESAGPH